MTQPPLKMTQRQVLEALSGLLLGMFVSMLANTVVSTSLPVIVHELGGDQAAYTWVVTASLLTTAISTPIWGKLADLMNRKLLFQLSIAMFVLATAAAGFSDDITMMIAWRAVQGLGAGGLAALSQVIMADIISPRERGKYMGLFGAVMALSTIGGPLLGGMITDTFNWRWNFYIALPFAIIALILVQKTLHLPKRPKQRVKIDYFGIVLLATASSLLLIWVTSAGKTFEWWGVETALMLGGAIVSTIVFIIVEMKSSEPLVPLSLFRDRTFTLAVLASISTGIAMFGASVYLAQYMQLSRGATPTQAGLMTIPMIAGLLLSSVIIGAVITRTGKWKRYLLLGATLLVAGSITLSTIRYDTNFGLVSVYMFLLGAGVGMTMQNLVLIVQNTTAPQTIGVASSGVTFFRSLGGTVGVSVMGAALATRVADLFGSDAVRKSLGAALAALGPQGAEIAEQLQSGTIPSVVSLPHDVRIIVEDVYAQGISASFLIGVPFAILSLLAIIFLPNTPLTRMTNTERSHASEADLATVSTSSGMAALTATGKIRVVGGSAETGGGESGDDEPGDGSRAKAD